MRDRGKGGDRIGERYQVSGIRSLSSGEVKVASLDTSKACRDSPNSQLVTQARMASGDRAARRAKRPRRSGPRQTNPERRTKVDQTAQSQRELNKKILDRIASDPTFREELLDDPRGAMERAGFRWEGGSDDEVSGYAL